MGCCENKETTKEKLLLMKDIKSCIENDDNTHLLTLCKMFGKGSLKSFNINNFRFQFKSKAITIPAYCIYLNKPQTLSLLHQNFQIDYITVEDILSSYECSALQLICTNNFFELLEFYLPIYLNLEFKRPSVCSEITLDLQSHNNFKSSSTYTPIQLACELGYIQIIFFIQSFFQTQDVPTALDINFVDPSTGENCALIACRACNYSMIKFLHMKCNADFNLLNNKHESAIQILASSGKKSVKTELLTCLIYLVEKIGLNILYGFEETLLILENSECVAYFERQLALRQVFISKTELEYINRVIKRNSEEAGPREIHMDKNSHPSPIEPTAVQFESLDEVMNLLIRRN